MALNDTSNWATITGSYAAPVVGVSPPLQWDDYENTGIGDGHGPDYIPDVYYFVPCPSADSGIHNFEGLGYIGPSLVGTLQVNWKQLYEAIGGVLTVGNRAGTLATLTLPLPPIIDPYSGVNSAAVMGALSIPMTLDSGLKIALMDPNWNEDYHFGYFLTLGTTFSFVPGSGTGPVTGGDPPPPIVLATGYGINIWRPRDNNTT